MTAGEPIATLLMHHGCVWNLSMMHRVRRVPGTAPDHPCGWFAEWPGNVGFNLNEEELRGLLTLLGFKAEAIGRFVRIK